MTLGQDLAPKRTRESTSKVRTGCSTCKARRVKCDEAKPICRRCAAGNRKCEYNNACTAPTRRNVITIYMPPMQSQPTFFVNARGLEFFHQNLAAKLDGQFDSSFWSRLVLQLSHSEPSVRHAVSAISNIYRDVESSLRHPEGYVSANPEAQQEWNKAIRSLSARIQARPNSNLVPLVCCLLFTCIDFLRGNVETSMLHVESGLNILAAARRNSHADHEIGSDISKTDLQTIENHVVPVFAGLSVLSSLAGRTTPPIYAPTAEDSPHEDLADSRRRLLEVSDACIRFIGKACLKVATFQVDVDDLVDQVRLQTRLDAWRKQLGKLVDRTQAGDNPVKQDALSLLLVNYKVIYIWLRVCTTAGETATDFYLADFDELVHYAEQIAQTRAGEETARPQPLSFDTQTLGPLYYAALKCRHPATRRRALELLQFAPLREGLWNAHHAYLTAKRVIELEERDLKGEEWPDESSRLHGLVLPNDMSRIDGQGEIPFDVRRFDHSIVPSPAYPGTLKAVFWRKPWGLSGEWESITEYIKI